jgi:hypothetical protein
MACNNVCKLCNRFIISNSVTFTGGNLVINIPAGSYLDNNRYCIVVAQNVPTSATINAPVFITIGSGTILYPVTKRDCTQLTACGVASRTRYAVRVETSASSGVFRMLGNVCCVSRNLTSINGTAPATASATSNTSEGS